MDFSALTSYEVKESRFIKEVNSEAVCLRHKKSGAHIVLLSNDDANKVFDIVFRTPVSDSTGVPHIIEHTVLCGSERYPVRDPFMELVKGSMNTFLNAMTAPERTSYPVASTNDADFRNLMAVYMDAVFHPNILKSDVYFHQEGWHYELDEQTGELSVNGVVFNEMKGAFSSVDAVLDQAVNAALFPDNTYAFVSGGDPEHIPDLTYEQYLAFYNQYYHPANSFICLYGDCDMEERLEWMDREVLSQYDFAAVHADIPFQKPFEHPVEVETAYSSAEEDEDAGPCYAWSRVCCRMDEIEKIAALELLENVLLEIPGAPLKEALMRAGLGEDVYGMLQTECMQPFFTICAKNAQADSHAFASVIEKTLRKIVDEGVDKRSLLGAINSTMFRTREADFGRYPRGLFYASGLLSYWSMDEEHPFRTLETDRCFAFLKEQLKTDYYENLIRECLLDNPHGALVSAVPDEALAERREQAFACKMAKRREAMTKAQLDKIRSDMEVLRRFQETPDTPEALESIPLLKISDLNPSPRPMKNEERKICGIPVVWHDYFTSGISYVDAVFTAEGMTAEDIQYSCLFDNLIGLMNTDKRSYIELSQDVDIFTGGVLCSFHPVSSKNEKEPLRLQLRVSVRALYENLEKGLSLALEELLHTDFSDLARLREILGELRSRQKESLTEGGHATAIRRASSGVSMEGAVNELTNGVAWYDFLDDLYRHTDEKQSLILAGLKKVQDLLIRKGALTFSITSDRDGLDVFEKAADTFIVALNDGPMPACTPDFAPIRQNEGLTCSTQVQFSAQAGSFLEKGLPYTGALRVLTNILNTDYLWKNIREQGGAYGCMCGFGQFGRGYFASYMDPHLGRTYDVFKGIPGYIRSFEASPREMTKFIIGAVSEVDAPLPPSQMGAADFVNYQSGITQKEREDNRQAMLECTAETIRELAPYAEAVISNGCICTVGSEGKIDEAAVLFDRIRQI